MLLPTLYSVIWKVIVHRHSIIKCSNELLLWTFLKTEKITLQTIHFHCYCYCWALVTNFLKYFERHHWKVFFDLWIISANFTKSNNGVWRTNVCNLYSNTFNWLNRKILKPRFFESLFNPTWAGLFCKSQGW